MKRGMVVRFGNGVLVLDAAVPLNGGTVKLILYQQLTGSPFEAEVLARLLFEDYQQLHPEAARELCL